MSQPRRTQLRKMRASVDYTRSGLSIERFSSQVSYHEAGHAFACWYLQIPIYKVQVLRRKPRKYLRSRRNVVLKDVPGVSETEQNFCERLRWRRPNGAPLTKLVCVQRIFISYAGPKNSSIIVPDHNIDDFFATSGSHDAKMIEFCRQKASIGDNAYKNIISTIESIMALPEARKSMLLIAEWLTMHGHISGSNVNRLCSAAFPLRLQRRRISN